MGLLKVKQEYISKNGEKKWFWRFYLKLENGNRIEVKPIHYKLGNGNYYDNTNVLVSIATEIK